MKNEIPKWLRDEAAACDIALSPAPATVLDIGANVGAFALRARAKWPRAAIRCYEPVPKNYEALVANLKIRTHHPKLVRAYRFAVRNFCGHDNIFIGHHGVTCGFHQLGRQTSVTERVMCVDAAGVPGAELVKIDTEGCEVEILSRLDLRKTRALVVEYHRAEDVEKLNAIALGAGLPLLEQTPASQTHGILKYGRPEGGAGVPASRPGLSAPGTISHKLSTRKIYCAVASHFSNHDLVFLQSMMQLLLGAQVRMSFGWSCDPSVERARNVLTANFLASDCTHLLFIDSDIAFTPRDVMRIVSHDQDVVGGIYPLKTMDRDVKWCGNGLGQSFSNAAAEHTGDGSSSSSLNGEAPGAPVSASRSEVRPDGLQEVACIGTGFMCIARRVFKKLIAADGDKLRYQQDWPPHREEFAFWRQTVRDVNGRRRFLTEDWNFCYRYRELGGRVFADTGVILRHAGRAVWPLDLQNGNPFVRIAGPVPAFHQPSGAHDHPNASPNPDRS